MKSLKGKTGTLYLRTCGDVVLLTDESSSWREFAVAKFFTLHDAISVPLDIPAKRTFPASHTHVDLHFSELSDVFD